MSRPLLRSGCMRECTDRHPVAQTDQALETDETPWMAEGWGLKACWASW